MSDELPIDPNPVCGVWIFSLDPNHPFTRACALHDIDFLLAEIGKNDKTLNENDSDLFWRWTLIARAQEKPEDQIKLMLEICRLFPVARIGGRLLWDGDDIKKEKQNGKRYNNE